MQYTYINRKVSKAMKNNVLLLPELDYECVSGGVIGIEGNQRTNSDRFESNKIFLFIRFFLFFLSLNQ